jgi:hypothetical protein
MPLSACFFILLIYEAIAVWRKPVSPSAESALSYQPGTSPQDSDKTITSAESAIQDAVLGNESRFQRLSV